jgi:hypothetical protein
MGGEHTLCINVSLIRFINDTKKIDRKADQQQEKEYINEEEGNKEIDK